MFKIGSRPYQLLFLTALLMILLSVFTSSGTLQLQRAQGQYIDGIFVLRAVGMFLLLSWLMYCFTRKLLYSRTLIWLHVVISMLLVTVITSVIFKYGSVYNMVHLQQGNTEAGYVVSGIPALWGLLFAAKLLYMINLLLGLLRRVN